MLVGGRVAGGWEGKDGVPVVTSFEDLPDAPLRAEIACLTFTAG